MTDAELKIWSMLRRGQFDGHHFRKQVPIGPYVADFACLKKRLVVEIDGGQHAVNTEPDKTRTEWLEAHGYRVLRFWNNEILTASSHAFITLSLK